MEIRCDPVETGWACTVRIGSDAAATFQNYYLDVLTDSTAAKPSVTSFVNGRLNGSFPAANLANYGSAIIDVYLADPAALADPFYYPKLMVHPMTWLRSSTT